ncbi:hypothetical protein Tco_0300112 [Tanacetum coccineum]
MDKSWSNRSVDLNVSIAMYGYVFICVCVGYVRLDNQSIERDRLIGIGFVLNFVKFISFTFGDKEMISVIEAVSRIHKDGDGDASFQLKSDSLPHAHAQTTKTFYKHQDSRIMKAQELKTKTSAQTLIYKIFLQRYQVYQGRLLASFQDDAKYEHVGQDTRSQGGKDDQDGRIKI